MRDMVVDVLRTFDWFVLGYFLVLNTSYLVLVIVAAGDTTKSLRRSTESGHDDIFANPLTPPISVVMGAYNEEACIVESVRATLGLRYPQFEVVVIDDGSTDGTFDALRNEFDLIDVAPDIDHDVALVGAIRSMHVPTSTLPLVVVRKTNVGKRADALNAGLNAAQYPLVCCVDADSILERDALLRVAKPFVDDPERVIATGGVIRAVNGSTVYRGQLSSIRQPRSWLARIQIIEYLRSFLLGRTGWSKFGSLLIISGAFGLYRRDLLLEIGGFDPTSLGEDADAIIALHKLQRDRGSNYRIVYVPEPVCWTEVPTTRDVLGRQRSRWSHGLAQVLWKYRHMMCNPKYGRIGMVAMPYYLVFELLDMVGGMSDISARKEAEDEIRNSRHQLRALSARLESLREEERTRIAREIHDELGQMLTGLKMDLRWIEKKVGEIDGHPTLNPVIDKAVEAGELADQTITAVQRIAAELRPGVLDQLGLFPALKHEAQRFHKRTSILCQVELPQRQPELPPQVATAVFRIFQETLTNVARHAEAAEVRVTFREEGSRVILEVADNGRGLPPDALRNPKALGLLGMKERAAVLGGDVQFHSSPGRGTSVTLRLPLTATDTEFLGAI